MPSTPKKQPTQLTLLDPDLTWIHLFNAFVRSETYAELSPPAVKVYIKIRSLTNSRDLVAFPKLDTLQATCGMSRPTVIKALRELEEKNLLKSESKVGIGGHYQILDQFPITDEDGKTHAVITAPFRPNEAEATVQNIHKLIQGNNYEHVTINFVAGNLNNIENKLDTELILQGVKDILANKDTPEAQAVKGLALAIKET